ncbi:MAG: Gfo/Idh/MocA family oxidoreductase [Alphaproteobacteria bacterium]
MAESGQMPPGIAVIGCGLWGRNLVRTLAALGALRAVHDTDPDAAAAAAKLGDVPARGPDDILADPAIAGIVIATPDATHADIAARALAAGKPVLVEKPMAMSVGDGAALSALARDKGRTLMAGHILLYHPGFLQLCEMARSGVLGEVRHITSKRLHIARGAPRDTLWDLGPHDLSMILALTGCLPATVRAQAAAPLADAPPQQVNLQLTFADGPSADITLSALHPVKLHQFTIAGTEAFGIFEDSRGWDEKVSLIKPGLDGYGSGAAAPVTESRPLPPEEPLRLEMQAFLDAVGGGPPPANGAAEALEVVRVLGAAQESLDSGDLVVLDRTAHDNLET